MRRWSLVVGVLATVLVACRTDTVQLTFSPAAGASYRYDVRVQAVTRSTLGDAAPRKSSDDFVIHAEHRVVRAGGSDTELEVRLDIPGVGIRTFTARFDQAAQLSSIESIEGVPAAALGQLGLSEILPGATGAPPKRALAPGDRWRIDAPADVVGGKGSRLSGQGRLVELGVVRGRDVATIESRYRLPVKRSTASGDATIELNGTQSTVVRTVRAIADGAVESAVAETTAEYAVTLTPPAGSVGAPVRGLLSVSTTSTTSRLP